MLRGRRNRRRWGRIVSVLAAMVVFCTTYMLILPAITMERGAISVESETDRQALGESVATVLSVEARDDAPETYFALRAEGVNAGLDEAALGFDGEGRAELVRRRGAPYRAAPRVLRGRLRPLLVCARARRAAELHAELDKWRRQVPRRRTRRAHADPNA